MLFKGENQNKLAQLSSNRFLINYREKYVLRAKTNLRLESKINFVPDMCERTWWDQVCQQKLVKENHCDKFVEKLPKVTALWRNLCNTWA